MAEGLGNAVLLEIAKRVIQPATDAIVRQFIYLFCYKRNINKLNERVEQLKLTIVDAERFMDSAVDRNEEPTHTSIEWLVKVKAAESAANGIKEATEEHTWCFRKWCLKPKQRYVLSRKAVKKAKEIQQLLDEGKDYVSTVKHALPPSKLTGALANDDSKDFETRLKIMKDIMKALEDDKISIIGICGTGGVGKTTLMHELRERVKANDLFNEVAMTTVSQNPDLNDIRGKLAEMLGLPDKKNEIAAADEIHKRLTKTGRRTLVILDDIWGAIKLEELGIPIESDQTDCKVVLTSRFKETCLQMKAHKTIPVAIMPPDEAWYLFRKTAGDCVESGDLKEIAKKVADECGGLPIALVTLAKALSNKKIEIWRDALKQLTEHSVTRIPDMDKKVYSSIKLSFDFVNKEQPEARSLLLLCCQHPEDAAIEVENLARYCLALRLFKNIDTLEGVRDAVFSSIEYLKSCFLLEEAMDADLDDFGSFERVKLHDIIRDVGLKEERDGGYMLCIKKANPEISEALNYQNLKILVQLGKGINTSFLSQMEELRVLVLEQSGGCWRDVELHPVEGLTNLRMLNLERARLGGDSLSIIERLTKLELLSLRCSSVIGPFPRQIRQLSDLKLLDLRTITRSSYGKIPRGILAELNKLEELHLGDYYFSSTRENGEQGMEGEIDGRITELEKLSNLTALQIHLDNPMELLDLDFRFEKLQRFYLKTIHAEHCYSRLDRKLCLKKVPVEWLSQDKIESILRRTEYLILKLIVDWTDPLIIKKFVSLWELRLEECDCIEYLISDVGANAFRKLEELDLMYMDGLTELCHNGSLPAGLLGKLRVLRLYWLPKMRHLWVGATDSLCLVNLRVVEINYCLALECIFPHSAVKCLVQLQGLNVQRCRDLKGIVSKGEGAATTERGEIVQVEELTDLNILHFPKLRSVTFVSLSTFRGFYNDDDCVQSLLTPLVMLPSLEQLHVLRLDQLKQIVSGRNVAIPNFVASDCLQNLVNIYVESCASLETVFDFVELEVTGEDECAILNKLQDIKLKNLPKLEHVCRLAPKEIHVFRNLTNLSVKDCCSLAYIFSSSVARMLEKVECLSIENCKSIKEGILMNDECGGKIIVFRCLRSITLKNLEKLSSFCSNDQLEFEFPSLENVSIICCPEMKMFCYGCLTAEKLQGVKFASKSDKPEWDGDLNQTVQHFNARYQKENDVGNDDDDAEDIDDDDEEEEEEEEEEKVDVGEDADSSDNDNSDDVEAVADNVPGDGDGDENAQSENEVVDDRHGNNEVLDHSSNTQPEQGTLHELTTTEEFHPNASEDVLTTSTKRPHTSPKKELEKVLSDSLSGPDDGESNRILIQGVYIKSNMKTAFEEILKENPNFLSAFRVKTDAVKTAIVETAIRSLQILTQDGRLSSEQLVYVRNALDDLAASGLDVDWLERDYERASIVLDEEKVVMLEAELGRLESEVRKDAFEAEEKMEAFQMAKEKLEATTALRDGFKAKHDALKRGLEERKQLISMN